MNQSPTPVASVPRTLKTLAVVTRLLLWLLLAAWGLFALTWGALHFWIVPRIGDWRPELEGWASRAVGVPVQLGEIRAESRPGTTGFLPPFMPSFELLDVRLHDPQGRVALQLPLVRAAISAGSLWRLSFQQVVIQQPVLDVRRTTQGRIEVAGLDLSGADGGDGRGADWFFSQAEFVILGGTVRWTDEMRAQPPLVLDSLDLVVRNTARTHQIRLDATPPPEWGDRLSLRARLREPLLDLRRASGPRGVPWERWDGELYADFQRVDMAQLRAYVDLSEWGVELRSGRGGLRAWADVSRGQIAGVTADMALRDVDVQLGPDLPALLLDELGGRLASQWDGDGFSLTTEALQFRSREGLLWPGSRLQLQHRVGLGGRTARFMFAADRLDLAALSSIATRLPLPGFTHEALASLQPAGLAEGLSASWQGDARSDPAPGGGWAWPDWDRGSYQAKGRVTDLALTAKASERLSASGTHPLPGRPGVTGATVDFDFTQDGGRAQLSILNGTLDLPGVFEDSQLPVDQLQADASWRVKGDRIEAQLDNLRLSNPDAGGSAQVRWHTSDPDQSPARSRFPGVLDLTASLTRADATRVHRYLPLSVGPEARRYVRAAVRAGSASRVDFRMQGDMYDMPFGAPGVQGEFRIGAQLQNVDFDYVPAHLQHAGDVPWPRLRGVSGELLLDRTDLRLTGVDGGLEGSPNVRLSQADIVIDNLAHSATLVVAARARGPATELLDFVRNSPVNALTGQALDQARIGGAASLQFGLNLPIDDIASTGVSGTVQFAGNDLQISPDSPLLGRATGTLQFSEKGFAVTGAQARLYGGDIRFEGGMRPDADGVRRIQFRGQGVASAEGLREAGLGFVSRLFQNASGSTTYTAQLGFRAGVPELQVGSSLQGLTINLPAPLAKRADASLPLRFETKVLPASDDAVRSDRLSVQLGSPLAPLADLEYERDITGDEPRVLRGRVAVGLEGGETAPLPATGVRGNIHFSQIDLDAWGRAFDSVTSGTGQAGTPPPLRLATANSVASNTSLGYLPTTLAVRADRLLLGGRSFNRIVLGGSREDTLWRANIDADELNGYVEFRQPVPGTAGSVYARLARLNLAPSMATDVEQLLQQPSSVPALDIAVDDLLLASHRLGRVEVKAVNQAGAGGAREWRLTRLDLSVPEAHLSATGNWALVGPGGTGQTRRTALDFRLDIGDSGQLLSRFGREGLVRGGKGRIEGELGWYGSPLSIDYATLAGLLHADIERGQFLKVEPGAAKLLGVLSLQALPRRLVLDFRDVFTEGFAFDFVRGDATIERGVLFTNNLQMKGVNAAVLMEGSASIAQETQDLQVVVVPEINAGTASLIATAINPAVGLGTFLAQFLLRQPLQSAATQQFRITGGWADPQVEKIERGTGPPKDVKPEALQ